MAMPEGPVATLSVLKPPQIHGQTLETMAVLREDPPQGQEESWGQWGVEHQGQGEVGAVLPCSESLSTTSPPAAPEQPGDPGSPMMGPTQAQITTETIRDLEEYHRPSTFTARGDWTNSAGLTVGNRILWVSGDAELELWSGTTDDPGCRPGPALGLVSGIKGHSGTQPPYEVREETERVKEVPSTRSSQPFSPSPSPVLSPGQTLGCVDHRGSEEGGLFDLLRIVKHKPSAIVFSGEDNVSPTRAAVARSTDGEEPLSADEEDGYDGGEGDDDDEDDEEVPELPQYKEFLVSRRRRSLSRNRKALRKGQEVLHTGFLIDRGFTNKTNSLAKQEEEGEKETKKKQAQSPWCDSMGQLMRKLEELNLDIQEALSAGSSSLSDTPTDNDSQPQPIQPQPDLQMSAPVPGTMVRGGTSRPPDRPSESTTSRPGRRSRPLVRSRPLARSSLHSLSHLHYRQSRGGIRMTSTSAEIEGKEACDWLRAAGFPQYAQLYEDSLFPIDISSVKRDHDFLDRDLVEPLCRRLNTLNRCCSMKLDVSLPRKKTDDSDEDDPLAISKRWTFEWNSRRWSRLQDMHFLLDSPNESSPEGCQGEGLLRNTVSTESVLTDLSEPEITDISSLHSQDSLGAMLPDSFSMASLAGPYQPPRDMSHYNSLPIKSGRSSQGGRSPAKAILRRMEMMRTWGPSSRRKSGTRRAALVIGEPVLQGEEPQALQTLQCVPINQLEGGPYPLHQSCDNAAPILQDSEGQSEICASPIRPTVKEKDSKPPPKRGSVYLEDMELPSGSPHGRRTESQQRPFSRSHFRSYEDLLVHIPKDHKPGTFPKALSIESLAPATENRTSSPSQLPTSRGLPSSGTALSKKPPCPGGPRGSRVSVYDNVPGSHLYASTGDLLDLDQDHALFPHLDDIITHVSGLQQIVDHWSRNVLPEGEARGEGVEDVEGDGRTTPSKVETDGVFLNDADSTATSRERRDSGVGASLTRPRLRWPSFCLSDRLSQSGSSLQISSQSAGQLSLLQKFSLLRLTAIMEKYSMSNKHGWTWSVPKFMKRMKVPDYKDRSVFGVPLIVHTQRCGYPLPLCLQQALNHLRTHCLDQVGLFRKSGVKSRIQALRQECESSPDNVNYEDQSAYDVADMMKQFFRDLPEPLLTSKLGDTFLHIYQYVPKEQRLQAVRAAILLMSDENREVLQTLLCFLRDVTSCVEENQMTPMNLAVCLGPSLFHLNILKNDNLSPRSIQKKYTTGRPDQKDLSENLAATQGLSHMITECQQLFEIPEEMVNQSRNTYMEAELLAPPLDGLCKSHDDAMEEEDEEEEEEGSYHSHVEGLVQSLLKEARERTKTWVSRATLDHTELACKKVGDGNPLRRWRVSLEVCALPGEVLERLLRQRPLWQTNVLQEKVLETLDRQTDIYQYSLRSMAPHPNTDYVVLRSWRSDVSKGSSVLVCVSVDHEDSTSTAAVRGVVLESQYLLEPSGTGRTRLTHICRVDLKGRSPDWYNKAFGQLCVAEAQRIRSSFHPPDSPGPETKI